MACEWMISMLMSQVIAKSVLLLGEIPRKQLGLCNLIPAGLISVEVILKDGSTELGDCNSQIQRPAAQLGQGGVIGAVFNNLENINQIFHRIDPYRLPRRGSLMLF